MKPTAEIPVKIGVVTATKMSEVLASTTTTATGTFTVQITVPAVPSGGVAKIGIAAVAVDPATKLDYYAVSAINYPATSTTATPSPTASTTTSEVASSTSEEVPTAVPAGSGGAGASGGVDVPVVVAAGTGGVLLIGAGAVLLTRRRSVQQH